MVKNLLLTRLCVEFIIGYRWLKNTFKMAAILSNKERHIVNGKLVLKADLHQQYNISTLTVL